LYFAVSVNWIGPEFQRNVRGAPFHQSFSWATALPTAATAVTVAMPIAAAPIFDLIFFLPTLFHA